VVKIVFIFVSIVILATSAQQFPVQPRFLLTWNSAFPPRIPRHRARMILSILCSFAYLFGRQIHLMKFGSAAGTVDGLPAIMGCSDAVIPIAFDFDYVTGNTRSNMSCSNRYSMASFVSCNKENSVR
jgi:hypothetical protein